MSGMYKYVSMKIDLYEQLNTFSIMNNIKLVACTWYCSSYYTVDRFRHWRLAVVGIISASVDVQLCTSPWVPHQAVCVCGPSNASQVKRICYLLEAQKTS